MKTLTEIKTTLSQIKHIVETKYNLTQLGIFGVYARGEQNESSEVNILIDYNEAPSLLDLVDLEYYLTDIMGIKANVVTKKGLKNNRQERILNEVIYV